MILQIRRVLILFRGWSEEFLVQAAPQSPTDFPFVCIGNKLDKQSERKVPTQKAKSWADGKKFPHFEASAKDGTSVEDAFRQIAENALARESTQQPYVIPPVVLEDQTAAAPESGGCAC
eukprot:TRINITY_DN4605_c0_g1_i1.p1 TRINITY_DN4605_c0_g1~~TRINITY_DN4605_c0_g1_i1.p1  ORF type:complete len:119 (+),score=16.03 TRINITY_DN4605_c0_g1_i1:234-590(+)